MSFSMFFSIITNLAEMFLYPATAAGRGCTSPTCDTIRDDLFSKCPFATKCYSLFICTSTSLQPLVFTVSNATLSNTCETAIVAAY